MASKTAKLSFKEVGAKHAEVLKAKPWWTEYHDRLNVYVTDIIPKSHIVAYPSDESILEDLFKQNVVIPDQEKDVVFVEGESRACHDNCIQLLGQKKIEQMISGYAMSEDGLWRNHSWGKDKEGRIVETTCEIIAYLGVPIKVVREEPGDNEEPEAPEDSETTKSD